MNKRCLLYILVALFTLLALTGAAEQVSCDVCGQTADEMQLISSDGNTHTLQCACGVTRTSSHSWGAWSSNGDDTHTRTCSLGCTETKPCSGGAADCTTQAVCGTCSAPYGTPSQTHVWDKGVTVTNADCTNEGRIKYTCTVDPSHTKEVRTPVVSDAHQWDDGEETRASTCRTPGVMTYTCLNNSAHTYTEELPIDPEAHFFRDSVVLQPASCLQEGIISYTCLYSASHVVQETLPIDPTSHRWDGGTMLHAANCVENGEVLYTCLDNPNHTRIESTPVDLSLHEWDERIVTLEPTCSRAGTITLICALNSNHTGTESIPPIGHSWTISTVTQKPTCEETGVMTYTCSNDADHTKEEPIPALGHFWGNMELISAPTCSQEGEKSYICGNDIDHRTTVRIAIDPNAHSYVLTDETVTLPGVCTDGEARILRCEDCGDIEHEIITAPGYHIFSTWSLASNGHHTALCSVCSAFSTSLPCLAEQNFPCPLCSDGQLKLNSVYAITAEDAESVSDYAIGASAGSGVMQLSVFDHTNGSYAPAAFSSPIAFYLNAEQIAAALQPGAHTLERRAVDILTSDDCRILRRNDLVLLVNDSDALLLRVYALTPDGEMDELFCRIDSGVISFRIYDRHMLDNQLTLRFVLEEE